MHFHEISSVHVMPKKYRKIHARGRVLILPASHEAVRCTCSANVGVIYFVITCDTRAHTPDLSGRSMDRMISRDSPLFAHGREQIFVHDSGFTHLQLGRPSSTTVAGQGGRSGWKRYIAPKPIPPASRAFGYIHSVGHSHT